MCEIQTGKESRVYNMTPGTKIPDGLLRFGYASSHWTDGGFLKPLESLHGGINLIPRFDPSNEVGEAWVTALKLFL